MAWTKNALVVCTTAMSIAISSTGAMAQTMAERADGLLPLSSDSLATIGGPDTAAELIAGLSGRWFSSENVIRNWDNGGPDMLAGSMTRQCADDWENRIEFEPSGDMAFQVRQTEPDGTDNGSFVLTATEGRAFSVSFDEAALLAAYGLEDATAAQQAEMRAEFQAIADKPVRVWLPYPDIAIMDIASGTEVYFRCPQ